MDGTDRIRAERSLSVDFYRAAAAVLIVLGHWLAASVWFRHGHFGNDDVLHDLPYTQWLTLLFQVVPVFFIVAGYANSASWIQWQADGGRRLGWLRARVARTLGPTTVYVTLALVVIAALGVWGVDPAQVAFGGWAAALHLWFIPVYLVVVSCTPFAVAAQRKWGLAAPAVLAAAVALVDVVSLSGWLPLGGLNYLLCWAAIYQLGIAWYGGQLRGARAALLVVVAVAALILLIGVGPYPVSMVGVTGEAVKNTTPPTVALLALAACQAGSVITLAPAVDRRLRRSRLRAPLVTANRNVMMLYLWHMVPVVVLSLVVYPAGLLPEPTLGSGGWWLNRLLWLAILSVLTAAELFLLWLGRSWTAAPLPAVSVPLLQRCAGPVFVIGAALSILALFRLAGSGFTSDGRFPGTETILLVVGMALLVVSPVAPRRPSAPAPTDMRTAR